MKIAMKYATILALLPALSSDAFMTTAPGGIPSSRTSIPIRTFVNQQQRLRPSIAVTAPSSASRPLYASEGSNPGEDKDNEIERLKAMAAKLRAEAAQLEAEQAETMAQAANRAFSKFDLNQDGQIGLEELKAGLEKAFKMELPESRVKKLLDDFDKSGDGALQPEEFVTVEQLRNKLDALARDEKAAALEAKKTAKLEEEAAKFVEARLELLNDKPPSGTDKLVSVLPYLFPLLDTLQFARFLVIGNPDNPLAIAISIIYALYRSIPFGGFIAFFALSFLSSNPTINRLVRFNMQQAIFLDIALFFPGLLAGLYALLGSGLGLQLPPAVTELGTDAVFFTMVAAVAYASVSSLLGITPDKLPIISQAVIDRMPSLDMFDEQGRFIPSRMRDEDKDDEEKKD